mmetsp:Transcript_65301/g.156089  ORF Transcript_65301/g.156089 Transcript_65301/m.156089 type:complete len:296 (+) Transcript_65301:101-988(+)
MALTIGNRQDVVLPARATVPLKDWSPIDRMLATKHPLKGRRAQRPPFQAVATELLTQSATGSLHAPVPAAASAVPVVASTPTPSFSVDAGAQTSPWQAVIAEACRPQKEQIRNLQAELQQLQKQLAASEAARVAAESAAGNAKEEVLETRQVSKQVAADAEARHKELESLRRESAARKKEREYFEKRLEDAESEIQHLRSEAERARRDQDKVVAKCAELREQAATVTAERDGLLQRLEVEQAEMIKRVDALERRDVREKKSSRRYAVGKEPEHDFSAPAAIGTGFAAGAVRGAVA